MSEYKGKEWRMIELDNRYYVTCSSDLDRHTTFVFDEWAEANNLLTILKDYEETLEEWYYESIEEYPDD